MELKDIAAVAGKPGLYKIIKPARTGLILESLDANKNKLVTGPNHRVSVLNEISVYTVDVDKTVPLDDILHKIHDEFGDDPGVDGKSDKDELFAFMKVIVPDFDTERVYPSDIKKIVNWYSVILKEAKEVLEKKPEDEKEEVKKEHDDEEVKKQPSATAKTKKSATPENKKNS